MKRILATLVFLSVAMSAWCQPIIRTFFDTNADPIVDVVAGVGVTVTPSLIGVDHRRFTVSSTGGAATNLVWPVAGTNVNLQTNGFEVTINADVGHGEVNAASNTVWVYANASSNALWIYTTGVSNAAWAGSNALWGFTSGTSNNVITTSNLLWDFTSGVSNNVIASSNVVWSYANASSNALWIYTTGVSNALWTASNSIAATISGFRTNQFTTNVIGSPVFGDDNISVSNRIAGDTNLWKFYGSDSNRVAKLGDMKIGAQMFGGTSNSVLFVDTNNFVAEDPSNLVWLADSKRLGIGTNLPSAALHVVGAPVADSSSAPVGDPTLIVKGPTGANGTNNITSTGGASGNMTITGGNGGIPTNALATGTGGAGQAIVITTGNGGSPIYPGTNAVGGNGGTFTFQAGTGGTPLNATNTTGGNGGAFTMSGGAAGNSITNTGGSGGGFGITAGPAGHSTGRAGGPGGGIAFNFSTRGVAGGSGHTSGGNSGSFTINSGNGGVGGTGNGGTGSQFTWTGGNGGNSTNGGNAGPGGAFTATGGNGGVGTGGGTNGAAGNIILSPGTATSPNSNGVVILAANAAGTPVGTVGVGTNNPSYTLHVNGSLGSSNSFRISTNTAFADNEHITEARLQVAINSLRPQIFHLWTNINPVITSNFSLALTEQTDQWLTNVLSSGSNNVGFFFFTNQLGATQLPAGPYSIHVHALKNNAQDASLTWELMLWRSGTLVYVQTGETANLSQDEFGYDLGNTLSTNFPALTTDLIGLHIYETRSAGAVTVRLHLDGETECHFSTPSLTPSSGAGISIAASIPGILQTNGSLVTITNIPSSIVKGTVAADNAAAGFIGEYLASYITNAAVGAAGTFIDLTNIVLTAGDWDVSVNLTLFRNGASFTGVTWDIGISTTSGNSFPMDDSGLGQSQHNLDVLTTFTASSISIPAIRVNVSSQTTYYLKNYVSGFTVATPYVTGIVSARRVR